MLMSHLTKLCLVILSLATALHAEPDHHHHHGHHHGVAETLSAPNGGRLIDELKPQLEFLLLDDRRVQVSAVDDHGAVIPVDAQSVQLIGGERSNPIRMALVREGNALVSEEPLPDLEAMPVILLIKSDANADLHREKFYLATHICSGCGLKEYACTCGH